jgi:hypothetical protein
MSTLSSRFIVATKLGPLWRSMRVKCWRSPARLHRWLSSGSRWMTWLGGGLSARILPSWESAVDIAEGTMPHNPVTGRKPGGNRPGLPESTSRCAASEQESRTLGARHIAAIGKPPTLREPASEGQERYGMETVSARIDGRCERVVAGSGRTGGRVVIHMDEDKAARGLHSGPVDVLRLLIVDEHQMVTEALAARLSAAPGLWIAGCATTSDPRLPEKVRWLRPDVIIIDVEPLGVRGR